MSILTRRQLILFSLGLSVFSILAAASGCPVQIKNIEFCRDKGQFGAVCAYWLNAKETARKVPLSEWNKKRFGMVCTSEAGAGNINALIETFCQSRECVERTQDLISALKKDEK